MLALIVFFVLYLGFAFLALSQERHWRTIGDTPPLSKPAKRCCRLCGGSFIFASSFLAVLRDGISFGILLWTLSLSISAFAVALTIAWQRQWLSPLALTISRISPWRNALAAKKPS